MGFMDRGRVSSWWLMENSLLTMSARALVRLDSTLWDFAHGGRASIWRGSKYLL